MVDLRQVAAIALQMGFGPDDTPRDAEDYDAFRWAVCAYDLNDDDVDAVFGMMAEMAMELG